MNKNHVFFIVTALFLVLLFMFTGCKQESGISPSLSDPLSSQSSVSDISPSSITDNSLSSPNTLSSSSPTPISEAQQNINNPADKIVVSGLMVSYSIDELIQKSDCIVTGKVVSISSAMDSNFSQSLTADQIKMGVGVPYSVYRDVLIQPTSYLYGEKSNLLAIRAWGGKTNDRNVEVEDEPTFSIGEDILVFLYYPDNMKLTPIPEGLQASSYYSVMGLSQGKFQIKDGQAVNSVFSNSISISTLEQKIAAAHGAR